MPQGPNFACIGVFLALVWMFMYCKQNLYRVIEYSITGANLDAWPNPSNQLLRQKSLEVIKVGAKINYTNQVDFQMNEINTFIFFVLFFLFFYAKDIM